MLEAVISLTSRSPLALILPPPKTPDAVILPKKRVGLPLLPICIAVVFSYPTLIEFPENIATLW